MVDNLSQDALKTANAAVQAEALGFGQKWWWALTLAGLVPGLFVGKL